jgi:DNA-binding NarL/FixJ family response regulator
MTEAIRILVVDDHALVRSAISELLEREPRFEVVGTAGTADEALEMIVKCEPTIILMDIDMPGMVSFEAVRRIAEMRPEAKIIFLSAFMYDHFIDQALAVRARGYLTKRETAERVVSAILEVASGGACFSEEVQSRIAVGTGGARLPAEVKSRAAILRPRELETICYIARGMSKKKIAEQMNISIKTVEHHTMNLMSKLQIHDRVELARYAIREGLIQP